MLEKSSAVLRVPPTLSSRYHRVAYHAYSPDGKSFASIISVPRHFAVVGSAETGELLGIYGLYRSIVGPAYCDREYALLEIGAENSRATLFAVKWDGTSELLSDSMRRASLDEIAVIQSYGKCATVAYESDRLSSPYMVYDAYILPPCMGLREPVEVLIPENNPQSEGLSTIDYAGVYRGYLVFVTEARYELGGRKPTLLSTFTLHAVKPGKVVERKEATIAVLQERMDCGKPNCHIVKNSLGPAFLYGATRWTVVGNKLFGATVFNNDGDYCLNVYAFVFDLDTLEEEQRKKFRVCTWYNTPDDMILYELIGLVKYVSHSGDSAVMQLSLRSVVDRTKQKVVSHTTLSKLDESIPVVGSRDVSIVYYRGHVYMEEHPPLTLDYASFGVYDASIRSVPSYTPSVSVATLGGEGITESVLKASRYAEHRD